MNDGGLKNSPGKGGPLLTVAQCWNKRRKQGAYWCQPTVDNYLTVD
ncbi:MAG: hypothetical protein ACI4UB_01565 [Limosilactobacillus sp.]